MGQTVPQNQIGEEAKKYTTVLSPIKKPYKNLAWKKWNIPSEYTKTKQPLKKKPCLIFVIRIFIIIIQKIDLWMWDHYSISLVWIDCFLFGMKNKQTNTQSLLEYAIKLMYTYLKTIWLFNEHYKSILTNLER